MPVACWDPSLDLTACIWLTEISLSLIWLGASLGMEPHLALLSTIYSPHLRKITLTFSAYHFLGRDGLNVKFLAHEEWGAVEEVFLQLGARSRDVVNVVMRIMVVKRRDSDLVPKLPDCGKFMPRFKEVGKVEVRLL